MVNLMVVEEERKLPCCCYRIDKVFTKSWKKNGNRVELAGAKGSGQRICGVCRDRGNGQRAKKTRYRRGEA
jgi:hypothetical protein